MKLSDLITLSKQSSFNVGPYCLVSQQPSALPEHQRDYAVSSFLPQLIQIWKDIEQATGYRWKCTSYIRDSPSHKRGHAIDLAPHIATQSIKHYAVYNSSDPVLYKRGPLVKALQTLKNKDYSGSKLNDVGIFLEPDHLHVQILAFDPSNNRTSTIKWGIPKPIYSDTGSRMNLKPTNIGYLKSKGSSPSKRGKL